MLLDEQAYRSLEAAEAQIEPFVLEWTRQIERCRITVLRESRQCRPSGIGQLQQPGDLVEGLACSVVERCAQRFIVAMTARVNEL